MKEVKESLRTAFGSCRVYAWAVGRECYLARTDIGVGGVSMAGAAGGRRGFLLGRPPTTTLLIHLLLLLVMVMVVLFELTAVAPLRPGTAQRPDHPTKTIHGVQSNQPNKL